ncbi:hypothetical protein CEXT_813361 [Caerostris extrusa]|uniref:Uncharacterized protein n=1 Tax=Caerostris extrusa TaxID=172846 RepID=A0AAV4M8F7_CAEEX|nr:hypothetical protein CEXT_813361 [Caerostris extrusa]
MNLILLRQILLWLLLVAAFSQISAQTTTTAAAATTTTTASTPVATVETTTTSSTTTPSFTTEAAGEQPSPLRTLQPPQRPSQELKINPKRRKLLGNLAEVATIRKGMVGAPESQQWLSSLEERDPSFQGATPQVEQGVSDAEGKKNNDQQAYIVWNVGQGNVPNGWTLSATPDGWGQVKQVEQPQLLEDGLHQMLLSNQVPVIMAGMLVWVEEQPTDKRKIRKVDGSRKGWLPKSNAERGLVCTSGAPNRDGLPPSWKFRKWQVGPNGPPQGHHHLSPGLLQPNGHQKMDGMLSHLKEAMMELDG